jgi:hypothetical protein
VCGTGAPPSGAASRADAGPCEMGGRGPAAGVWGRVSGKAGFVCLSAFFGLQVRFGRGGDNTAGMRWVGGGGGVEYCMTVLQCVRSWVATLPR